MIETTRIPQPVDIILATLRRASRAGESNEMAARWIMEALHNAGWGFGRERLAPEEWNVSNG